MTPEDRFGLQGDPEVQSARRLRFGNSLPWLAVLFLTQGSLSAFLSVISGSAALGQWGFAVTLLQWPVLAWGWWAALRAPRSANWRLGAAMFAYLLASFLSSGGKLIADLTFQRPADHFLLITNGLILVCLAGMVWGMKKIK